MGTDPATWKWVMIAVPGTFKGHPAGPFTLDGKVFEEIISNFKSADMPIPWDLEHASEGDATSGSIPTTGAPAQGWIHDLQNRGPAGLWALVEWGEQAKDYIRTGKYVFCSPAIRFGTRDRVTGAPIGARLSSCALTNVPFLTALEKLAAKDTAAAATVALKGKTLLDAPVQSPHAYMPKLRAALKMHELATPQECGGMVDKLRDMCMSAGPNGVHSGIQLGDYTSALADLAGASGGASWQDVFDAIDDMIDAAIEQHVIEDHGGGDVSPPADDDALNAYKDRTMADPTTTQALKDTQDKATELTTKLKDSEAMVGKLTGDVSSLTLQLKEAKAETESLQGKLTAAIEQVTTLKDAAAKRDEADLLADVEIALATYRDKKGLSDADKPHLLAFARSQREAFNKMYPPVAPENRHLLRTLTPAEPREKPIVAVSPTALTRRLMTDKRLPYADAHDLASRIIAGTEPNPYADGK